MKHITRTLSFLLILFVISINTFSQPPASWNYSITGSTHIILIQNIVPIIIDGVPAPTMDCYIGVFYQNNSGTLSCGGYTQWTGLTTNITSWGEDLLYPPIPGFSLGEEFQWKIYANGIVYNLIATYMSSMQNAGQFVVGGISGVTSLTYNCVPDVEAVSILDPLSGCGLSTTENVTVNLSNESLCNIAADIDLMYSINNGMSWVTETSYFNILIGDTINYTFTTPADFSVLSSQGGIVSDSSYNVLFKLIFVGDGDTTNNQIGSTVVNMAPPDVNLSGLQESYCLYVNAPPITLSGIPGGGDFSGTGVQGSTFLMGSAGFPFAGVGTHEITYTYYDAITGCNGSDTDTVTLYDVPIVTIGGYSSLEVCQYDCQLLTGNYPGGTFFGTPFISSATGNFCPLITGVFNIQYAYTDNNGCADTSDVYTFTCNPLPSVTIDNLSRAYCSDESNVILDGNPSGGTFSVDNIALSGNLFHPNIVSTSVHNIGYIYTDANGCTNDFHLNVKVFPLPNVSLTGLDSAYCQYEDSVELIGSPLGGAWTGTTWDNWFDPAIIGNSNIEYSYTQTVQYYGDTAICQDSDIQVVNVNELPQISAFVTNIDPPIYNYGSIEITPIGSSIPYSYIWSNGETTEDLYSLPFGDYYVTVENINLCNIQDSFTITYTNMPNWNLNLSGESHTIHIPGSTTILFNGNSISAGDFIGVFYDSLGVDACAGFIVWTGNTMTLEAYGDNQLTTESEGFDIGEEFNWIIWDASSGIEHPLVPSYNMTYPDQQFWQSNGESGIDSLQSVTITGTISTTTKSDLPLGMVVLYKPEQGSYYAIDKGLIIDGMYEISGILPGDYLIYAIPAPGYNYGIPGYFVQRDNWEDATLVNANGYTDGIDITIDPVLPFNTGNGAISGNIYVGSDDSYNPDVFGDEWFAGSIKDGETPARNIPVILYDNNMNAMDFRLSNETGSFEFEQLELGTYFVRVEKAGLQADEIEINLTTENPTTDGMIFSLESGNVVSIQESLETDNISIYPNPFKNEFTIHGINSVNNIVIYDILGKVHLYDIISEQPYTITLKNNANGVYFLNVTTENSLYIYKVIKSN